MRPNLALVRVVRDRDDDDEEDEDEEEDARAVVEDADARVGAEAARDSGLVAVVTLKMDVLP